jgi:hypothetical protein
MALTRPTAAQINSAIEVVTDPLSLFNNKSTQANIDVGFILNRDGGTNSNIALVWQETNRQFVIGLTSASGATNANITFTSYANLVVGNVSATYLTGSGQFLTGLPAGYSNVNATSLITSLSLTNYSNVNVAAYTQSLGYTNYSNVNVTAYTQSMGYTNYSNVNTAAYTQSLGYTNYSNVNLTAYLGGAVTIGGNLTVNGNLFVNGNLTTINANNLIINDSMIYLADDNPADLLDIGFVSSFTNPGYQHTGFVRDHNDGTWKLFANVTTEPTTTVDFTNASYSNLKIGNLTAIAGSFIGNITQSGLSTQYINTPGNVIAAIHSGGAVNVSGNVLGTSATFNNVVVNSGNINAFGGYFIGSGAYLTGLPASYSNVQVATYLPTYTGTVGASLINSTGNILATGGVLNSLTVNGNISAGNVNGINSVHFANTGTTTSKVYQIYNSSTNSLDTVFG